MFYRFFYNYSGGFVLLTAIILPMLIIVLISAINISEIYQAKITLQNAVDNSLMTTVSDSIGKEYLIGNKELLVRNIKNNMENSLSSYFSLEDKSNIINGLIIDISYDINKNRHIIKIDSSYKMPIAIFGYFLGQYGNHSILLSAHSSMVIKKEEKHASSIIMVIDISLSMDSKINIRDDKTKLQIAKESINLLIEKFKSVQSDHLKNYLRLGYVSFESNVDHIFNLQWGLDGFMDSVNKLRAKGATNSATAMLATRDMLLSPMEAYEHRSKGNYKYKKYVIFMTDGENSYKDKDDSDTISYCNDIEATGGEIYVVAISINVGRLHIKCAGSPTHLFSPKDVDSMRNAFSDIGDDISRKQVWLTK